MGKYRLWRDKVLSEGTIRRNIHEWPVRRIKDILGITYNKALGEHLLAGFRTLKERLFPWQSRRRRAYQTIVSAVKKTLGLGQAYQPFPSTLKNITADLKIEEGVSVVIPVYDRTDFLRESIESVLGQTYQNFELILVCDGSPAETLSMTNQYKSHPKVRVFRYKDNSGTSVRGRNRGIKEARGKYVAFLDSDDIAEPNRLEVSVNCIKKYNADIVYGNWRVRKEKGCANPDALCFEDGEIVRAQEYDYAGLLEKNYIPHSTVAARTEVLRRAGGLKPEMRYCEDYELWLRLADKGCKFKAIPEVLTTIRFHSGNLEETFRLEEKKWQEKAIAEYKTTAHLKPTIAFVIPSQGITGGTMVVCQHANRLLEKGYDVMIIDNEIFSHKKSLEGWFPYVWPEVISIKDMDKLQPRIDIAIATGWQTAYTVKEIKAGRKVYFIQSDETRLDPDGSEESELARQTYTFNFEMIVIAKWLRQWLKDNFNKNANYVSNGLDSALFYPDTPLEPKGGKLRVLLEGPIDVAFKGMKEAFEVVAGMDVEVWCVSSGGRPKPGWKCDRFFEKVPLKDMRKIYSSCDVLVKMSKVESFAMPPLEMMACGGTVIINKVTGYDEYIIDGYNALVVEQGDVKSAREKLALLMKDRLLLEKLMKGGLETARQWTWEYSNNKLVQTLEGQMEIKWE